MRDEYDDQYTSKLKALDFSCSMVLSMKKIFFSTGVNVNVEDKILRHLLTCQKCRRIYEEYAKEVGHKKFNLITYCIQFVQRNKDMNICETRDYLQEVKGSKTVRVLSRMWTRAANNFDLNKLMQLKAFRDLSMEYDSPTGLDYSEFMKYVTLKIAKHVDHLEECLLKSEEESSEEKKDARSK